MGARSTVALGAAHRDEADDPVSTEPISPVKLLLVDHPATRTGIRMALADEAVVCVECGEVDRAIRAAKSEQPDVALISREIAGDWRAAVRGVCRAAPGCGVIVLARSPDVEDMLEGIRAGALGYLPGTLNAENFRALFRFAQAREALIPRTMVTELLDEIRGTPQEAGELTGREVQVLGMVRRGLSTTSIAERLGIAPVTVRRHISGLVRKFGVENRAGLVEQRPD